MTMNIIRKLRKKLGLTQGQLAERAGTSQPQIKRLELSERKLTKEWAEKLAPHLGVDASVLLFSESEGMLLAEHPVGMVPVIGKVSAGSWFDIDDSDFSNSENEYVPSVSGYPISAQFAFTVDGNCLNKIASHGDKLVCVDIIEMGIDVQPNDLVIVQRSRFNGQMIERTAKRIRKTADGYELWPESTDPNHQEPIKIASINEDEEIRIIAKVLWMLRKP